MAGPQSERLGLQMDLGTHSTAKQQPRQIFSSTEIRELKLWEGSLRKTFGETYCTFNKQHWCLLCTILSDHVVSKTS